MEANSKLIDVEIGNDKVGKDKLQLNTLIMNTIIMTIILFVNFFLENTNVYFFVFLNIAILVCIFRISFIANKYFKIMENA